MLDNSKVIENSLKKCNNVLITYDGIINMKEIGLFKNYMIPNYDNLIDFYKLELFKNISFGKMIRYLDLRNTKDINKWLIRKDKVPLTLSILPEYINSDIQGITSFAISLINLLTSDNINKVTIIVDFNDRNAILIIKNLYGDFIKEKITLVNKTNDNFDKYLKDDSYDLVLTDESEYISNKTELLKGKTICIPYTGYNFIKEKINVPGEMYKEVLYSKEMWEFKTIKSDYDVGFMELFNADKYSIK